MKKIAVISVLLGICIAAAAASYSNDIQESISHKVLRLHVLANSNSAEDQALKLQVRDRILKEGASIFKNTGNMEECYALLNKNLPLLQAAAEDEIAKNGYAYSVKISQGKSFFPMKTYNSVALPAGEYEAVRVEIGSGEGENWWCVMFPPLCFVDAAVEESALSSLEEELSEEEMSLITTGEGVNIKFKVVDFFQNSINRVKTALNK